MNLTSNGRDRHNPTEESKLTSTSRGLWKICTIDVIKVIYVHRRISLKWASSNMKFTNPLEFALKT